MVRLVLWKGEISITLKDDAWSYQVLIRRVAQAMEKPLTEKLDRWVVNATLNQPKFPLLVWT